MTTTAAVSAPDQSGSPTPAPAPRSVYALIAAVTREVAKVGIAKGRRNEQQGFTFRGIDDVYNVLAPIISAHGLVVLPRMLSRVEKERQTRNGGLLYNVVVEAEFDFVSSEDGTTHVVRTFGEGMDSADKATNKAMSAAYKYACFQAFCIPTEADDADADSHEETVPPGRVRRRAADETPRVTDPNDARPITAKGKDGKGGGQVGRLRALMREHRADERRVAGYLKETLKYPEGSKWGDIQRRHYDDLCEMVQQGAFTPRAGEDAAEPA